MDLTLHRQRNLTPTERSLRRQKGTPILAGSSTFFPFRYFDRHILSYPNFKKNTPKDGIKFPRIFCYVVF